MRKLLLLALLCVLVAPMGVFAQESSLQVIPFQCVELRSQGETLYTFHLAFEKFSQSWNQFRRGVWMVSGFFEDRSGRQDDYAAFTGSAITEKGDMQIALVAQDVPGNGGSEDIEVTNFVLTVDPETMQGTFNGVRVTTSSNGSNETDYLSGNVRKTECLDTNQ